MSGVAAPVVWAVVIVLAGAWLCHIVVDHHSHLVLLKVFRPFTVVPETRHDSRWHSASHPRRMLVNILLTGAAVLIGLAWMLSPYVAAAVVIGSGLAMAITGLFRRAGRPHAQEGSKTS